MPAYIGIHQVRTLVFDNYQRCPVSLRCVQTLEGDFYQCYHLVSNPVFKLERGLSFDMAPHNNRHTTLTILPIYLT